MPPYLNESQATSKSIIGTIILHAFLKLVALYDASIQDRLMQRPHGTSFQNAFVSNSWPFIILLTRTEIFLFEILRSGTIYSPTPVSSEIKDFPWEGNCLWAHYQLPVVERGTMI